ncbi:uncharacterized protein Eint_021240 [Encephalitozoon intestinalis ATCC 50506]|uniref:Uncharacterized protein n=1 Tax=Encephalitozoon intestinalis (strain ATCC 50506) TaxID=876142 RepID=E0S5Y6_ENCIT|nr:uncharacterized protein Eint_021240 [Encephalitozoon intestinalis ATCC 50506]ADM11121.1 hypothetical protein Eint_021240 [Encephalitozoon intestinalis ATCC 50506]UTX44775.1 hypothetical protein GPK93_02g02950 [Encephalitozoon intestinalis]
MDEKLKEISRLVSEVKRKLEVIIQSSSHIKEFNYKVEALLAAFDAYTIRGVEHNLDLDKTSQTIVFPKKVIPKEKTKEETTSSFSNIRGEESLQEFIERMGSTTTGNKLFRNNAAKIARFLYDNREGAVLEEIIKNTGISRYRCVDILNTMLRADPPLVSKKFDKGFIYSIVLL